MMDDLKGLPKKLRKTAVRRLKEQKKAGSLEHALKKVNNIALNIPAVKGEAHPVIVLQDWIRGGMCRVVKGTDAAHFVRPGQASFLLKANTVNGITKDTRFYKEKPLKRGIMCEPHKDNIKNYPDYHTQLHVYMNNAEKAVDEL